MNQLITIGDTVIRQDQNGRYCLIDLFHASGSDEKNKPHNWLRLEKTQSLVAAIDAEYSKAQIHSLADNQALRVIHGGNDRGTYVCKELVYSYAMWISPAFNLKVIRTFDAVMSQQRSTPPLVTADKIQAGILLIESASKQLGFSNSSKLGAYQTLQNFAGLPNLMPAYAIDAPTDAVDGSSRPTASLSQLLKDNNVGVSTRTAFNLLSDIGIVKRLSRPSKSGTKFFWSITPIGMLYGKNITSPVNPRETQPHFYYSRFEELLKLMNSSTKAA